MNDFDLKLCDIQGRLFELSGKKQIPSAAFIRTFMTSDTAKGLDSTYNKLQWMGEEYLLDEVCENSTLKQQPSGEVFQPDVLYWIGYIYRYWHFYTGESSARIIRIAPVQTMKRNYTMFHTMTPELAIEKLKEINAETTEG